MNYDVWLAHKILICVLSLTRLNQQFNVVFGINVDILQFSFQCSLMFLLERVMGIEPTTSAWKAEVLPLNYTRILFICNIFDAAKRIWTSTGFLPLGPQPSASAVPPRPLAKRFVYQVNIIYCNIPLMFCQHVFKVNLIKLILA